VAGQLSLDTTKGRICVNVPRIRSVRVHVHYLTVLPGEPVAAALEKRDDAARCGAISTDEWGRLIKHAEFHYVDLHFRADEPPLVLQILPR